MIKNAIEALTSQRESSFLVGVDNFNRITQHFKSLYLSCLKEDSSSFNFEFEKISKEWSTHYKNHIDNKDASALKVLYLSGPEPQNDIEVFLKYGISISNI